MTEGTVITGPTHSWAHTVWWKLVPGIRLAVRYTAGVASPKHSGVSGGVVLPQGSRLASCAATEMWIGCGSQTQVRVEGESWEGFRDLASVKTNTCGHNVMKSVGAMVAVLAPFSSVVKTARFLCRADDYEPWSLLPSGRCREPLLFCLALGQLYKAELGNQSGSFIWCPAGLEKPVADLPFPF